DAEDEVQMSHTKALTACELQGRKRDGEGDRAAGARCSLRSAVDAAEGSGRPFGGRERLWQSKGQPAEKDVARRRVVEGDRNGLVGGVVDELHVVVRRDSVRTDDHGRLTTREFRRR